MYCMYIVLHILSRRYIPCALGTLHIQSVYMYNHASILLRVRAHRFESMAMASSSSDARQPTEPSVIATEKRKPRFQRSGICGPAWPRSPTIGQPFACVRCPARSHGGALQHTALTLSNSLWVSISHTLQVRLEGANSSE